MTTRFVSPYLTIDIFSEMIKQVVTKTGKNYEKALKILSCTNWDIKKVLNPPTAIVPSTKPVKRVHRK